MCSSNIPNYIVLVFTRSLIGVPDTGSSIFKGYTHFLPTSKKAIFCDCILVLTSSKGATTVQVNTLLIPPEVKATVVVEAEV